MKAASVIRALRANDCHQTLIHTGQHYDSSMSQIFFKQLELPEPDVNLGVGSGTHAQQTAQIMVRFEDVVKDRQPDMVVVYGDVNSTVAAALVCSKLNIPVAHVEAGLRSFDRSMPEEINRVLTDQISELLFTPSKDGDENLAHEGVAPEKIHLVGNVMIDTLIRLLPKIRPDEVMTSLEVESRRFILVTLHRPSNVDSPSMLSNILKTLNRLASKNPVIFPVHPRTRERIESSDLSVSLAVRLVKPWGYLEFLALQQEALVVITDSGGIQEETTYLGVPCLTVRENTERPVTVELGTNQLVGTDMELLEREVEEIRWSRGKRGTVPPLWDGQAGERIAQRLASLDRSSQCGTPVA